MQLKLKSFIDQLKPNSKFETTKKKNKNQKVHLFLGEFDVQVRFVYGNDDVTCLPHTKVSLCVWNAYNYDRRHTHCHTAIQLNIKTET